MQTTNKQQTNSRQYQTYQTAGVFWTNVVLNNPLVDYTSIEKVEIIAEQMAAEAIFLAGEIEVDG